MLKFFKTSKFWHLFILSKKLITIDKKDKKRNQKQTKNYLTLTKHIPLSIHTKTSSPVLSRWLRSHVASSSSQHPYSTNRILLVHSHSRSSLLPSFFRELPAGHVVRGDKQRKIAGHVERGTKRANMYERRRKIARWAGGMARGGRWTSAPGEGERKRVFVLGEKGGGSRRRSFVDIHAFLVVVIAMVVVVLPQEDVRRERCRGRRRRREGERGYNRPT